MCTQKKPYVIGIAGGSASGKTTYSNTLSEALAPLEVKVFHMDAYFKAPELRPQAPGPVTGVVYRDDNHPNTMELSRLAKDLEEEIKQGQFQVIIVEGLLPLWEESIVKQLDLKLFIDCRQDERIVRRLKRNMAQRGLSFDEIAEVYLDLVRYRHDEYVEPTRWRADLVINGSKWSDQATEMIVAWVRSKVS